MNVGIIKDMLFLCMSEDDFDSVVVINFGGIFCVVKWVLKGMFCVCFGCVILILSVVGFYGLVG